MITLSIILLILVFLYWKMKTSKSFYFFQNDVVLLQKWELIRLILKDKGYSEIEILHFQFAYDYFRDHVSRFDGATIVGDNYTIEGLSVTAMKHDYDCIMIKRTSLKHYIKKRIEVDTNYRDDLIQVKRKYFINTLTAYIMWFFLIATSPLYFYLTGGKTDLELSV